tara:strand:- start:120 stop:2126 length:2007 start_codon:yes stop_codon:yes gene_type:complete
MPETTDLPKLSPSKITAWLECEHYLTLKNRQNRRPKADEPVSEQREDSAQDDNTETTSPAPPKNFSEMLIEKGNFHERECLKRYKEEYGDSVLEVSDKEEGESFKAWVERVGNPLENNNYQVIFQMPFIHDGIHGVADFLEKKDYEGKIVYEPVDSKLTRTGAKQGHLLQLLFYAEAIEAICGERPREVHVLLGSGERQTFLVSDYWWYWQRLREQLKRVLEPESIPVTKPEKCSYCSFCEFYKDCDKQWRREDSLIFLKDGNKSYREALSEVGIDTLTGLALLPPKYLEELLRENMEEGDEKTEEEVLEAVRSFLNDGIEADFESAIQKWENNPDCDRAVLLEEWTKKPPDINVDQLVKLWRQARLQKIKEQIDETHVHYFSKRTMAEKMEEKEGGWKRGECLLHLPELNDHDIYLDFEGHPFWQIEHGLIFLFGYLQKREGEWEYKEVWAHDKDEEKEKATELVDFFHERFKNNPGMHVYHYNHTERVVLADLLNSDDHPMSSILNVFGNALGESPADMQQLNELVEEGVFVDLLAIVRNSLQAGTESFSLKVMEKLAGFERRDDFEGGSDAVLEYELYANADLYGIEKDEERLNGIAEYNEDDVEATYELHKWLLQERNNNPNLPDETLPVPEEDFEPTNADEVEVIKRLQGQIVEKIRGERNGN